MDRTGLVSGLVDNLSFRKIQCTRTFCCPEAGLKNKGNGLRAIHRAIQKNCTVADQGHFENWTNVEFCNLPNNQFRYITRTT